MASQAAKDEEENKSNPYLQRRAAKIAENEKRLRELGLLSTRKVTTTSLAVALTAPLSNSRTRALDNPSPAPIRRSKRLRHNNPVSLPDDAKDTVQKNHPPRKRQPVPNTAQSAPKISRPTTSVPVPANSARAIDIDVHRLLFGTSGDKGEPNDTGLLGKQLANIGKAFVMQESVRLAGVGKEWEEKDASPNMISFNKYSGVQEWRNNVLFLWVNLNAPQCEVNNEFPENGTQITWYGGSRMHDESPVIQKLIEVAKQQQTQHSSGEQGNSQGDPNDAASTPSSNSLYSGGILLWCRRYVASLKGFTPYTCLGRLSYQSHEPYSRPLAFVFNLVDYPLLMDHPDPKAQALFQEMIRF